MFSLAAIEPTLADEFPQSFFDEEIVKFSTLSVVDLSALEPGEWLKIEALGREVLVYRRNRSDLAYLGNANDEYLAFPTGGWKKAVDHNPSTLSAVWKTIALRTQRRFEKNQYRSLLSDFLVDSSDRY